MRCASRAALVVVALQVQHAVHDQVRVVRRERLALRARLARHDRRADRRGRRARAASCVLRSEGQHVGRVVLAAIARFSARPSAARRRCARVTRDVALAPRRSASGATSRGDGSARRRQRTARPSDHGCGIGAVSVRLSAPRSALDVRRSSRRVARRRRRCAAPADGARRRARVEERERDASTSLQHVAARRSARLFCRAAGRSA